ncbi:MAG: hypothetical protein PVI18_08725 [Desulfobacterales bacterium]|jgi:hypothetical protein
MRRNPCRQCYLKNQDKNNHMCTYCDKRLAYINHIDRALNFTITNTEEKVPTHRLPTLSRRTYFMSVISDGF